MSEIFKTAMYFIPIGIVILFVGIAIGIKLAGWALKNRRAGMANIKKMESE